MHISKRDTISRSKAWSIRAIAILLALIVDGIIIYAIVKRFMFPSPPARLAPASACGSPSVTA